MMVAVRGLFASLLLASCAAGSSAPVPDVRYEPTPPDVVAAMVALGDIQPNDVVADLGCGDGRIVIEALQRGAARGLCVDIDPARIAEARENARAAGVAERIEFRTQDLLATELRGVTVVMLFLSPRLNLELRPRLERELAPGARVVSHWHHMGDWPPTRMLQLKSNGRERPVYLWVMP